MVCPTVLPAGTCGATTGCLSPLPRSRIGWRRGEKKAQARMDTDFLDWALAAFSGYVAADELYDGPFCILSAVDNRRYKRILYEVLDHDPTHDDIRAFLGRLKTVLEVRDLTLRGVTTDGSSLYPEPLREVFGDVPHQLCEFHVLAEVVKAVVGAVASERKCLGAKQPPLPRGRPRTKAAQKAARKKKRLEQKRADLFTHRYLFVKHHLSKSERKTLWRITRGLPQLRKLREIMEQVYTLFDRRCRTPTALDKLAKLRRRLQRFPQVGETLKKLFPPTLEKALTFLDDKLLPSEGVPPFTRGVLGHEIGLVLARELKPLVPGHPLPLSSPQRIQWHVCVGRRGQDGCDRADAVCVSCHGDIPGRLCRLLDRTWHNGYPVRSAPAQLSPGVGDAGHALLAQGILPRRCACTVDVSPSDAVAISLSAGFLSQ